MKKETFRISSDLIKQGIIHHLSFLEAETSFLSMITKIGKKHNPKVFYFFLQ